MMLGRKTLKSERARMHRIDSWFEHVAQIMLVAYALFVFASWLSYRPSFAITHIAVEGTHAVSPEDVRLVAEKPLHERLLYRIDRNNALLYPTSATLSEIKRAYPRIANVSLAFDTRHQLRIVVEEYLPAILYCMNLESPPLGASDMEPTTAASSTDTTTDLSDCYFANDRGYVFAEAPTYAGYPFVAIVAQSIGRTSERSPVGTYALDAAKYQSIQTFVALLREDGFHTHAVELLPDHDVRIKTDQPWDILWTTTKDPVESTKNLQLVLRSIKSDGGEKAEIHFIDLRFGNKIFYK